MRDFSAWLICVFILATISTGYLYWSHEMAHAQACKYYGGKPIVELWPDPQTTCVGGNQEKYADNSAFLEGATYQFVPLITAFWMGVFILGGAVFVTRGNRVF